MAKNRAAWIMSSKSKPFLLDQAPLYRPGRGEILIRNHAVAVASHHPLSLTKLRSACIFTYVVQNPVDWKIQSVVVQSLTNIHYIQ
jgi:hypothetical protein